MPEAFTEDIQVNGITHWHPFLAGLEGAPVPCAAPFYSLVRMALPLAVLQSDLLQAVPNVEYFDHHISLEAALARYLPASEALGASRAFLWPKLAASVTIALKCGRLSMVSSQGSIHAASFTL